MDGGGFSFSGQGNLSGNGVMIYNTTSKMATTPIFPSAAAASSI